MGGETNGPSSEELFSGRPKEEVMDELHAYLHEQNAESAAEILGAYDKEPEGSGPIEEVTILPTSEHFLMPQGVYEILRPNVPRELSRISSGAHLELMGPPFGGKSSIVGKLARIDSGIHAVGEFEGLPKEYIDALMR